MPSLASTSLASAIRSGSALGVAVIIPFVLAGVLDPDQYRIWALAFSLSSYLVYLDLGLQGGVQALAGHLVGKQGYADKRLVVSAARYLTVLALVVVSLIAASIGSIRVVFPAVPPRLAGTAAFCLALLAAGSFANLLANVMGGYFTAIRDYWRATAITFGSRLLCAVAVAVAALAGGIRSAAVAYAAFMALCALLLLAEVVRPDHVPVARQPWVNLRAALFRYSAPVMIGNLCVLALGSVGPIAVARHAYADLSIYSLMLVLTNAVAAAISALLAPLLSEFAIMLAGKQACEGLLEASLRINGAVVLCLAGGVVAVLPLVARVFDMQLSEATNLGLALIVISTLARVAMSPLSLLYVASGRQARIVGASILDAVITVVSVLGFAEFWGIVGVAVGMTVGAVFGIVVATTWSRQRIGVPKLSVWRLLHITYGRGMLVVLLVVAASQLGLVAQMPLAGAVVAGVIVAAATLRVSSPLIRRYLPAVARRS